VSVPLTRPAWPLTVSEAGAALRSGALTSVELTTEMLRRADVADADLGTYLLRLDDQALEAAAAADADFARGLDRGPYHGIPIGMKDILAMSEGPTTAQSLILDPEWGRGRDGPVVSRLKAAGAVITGKVTTMEFAIGAPDATKPFPLPRNPWDVTTWTGGSSSGTGNGVAGGLIYAGIGTDTGGSIRIPAAFCGISGLMPTFGRVPKSGCVPLGYSLDHIGPMARSASDCAAMLGIIAGYDPSDESCLDRPVDDYLGALSGDIAGLRIGVERAHHFPAWADPALAGCFEAAVAELVDRGAEVRDVRLPYFDEVNTALTVTMSSEALAYHRRDLQTRWTDYFAGTRQYMAFGALVSGADYVQAQRVRRAAQQALAAVWAEVDLVISPTTAGAAPPYDDLDRPGWLPNFVKSIFTPYWDATGNPALSVPMGFNAAGLPLSLQLAARPFEEAVALRAGDAYQRNTDWHLRRAPVALEAAADTEGIPT
jgi:aspartyl-tRNA(Asn)/glutamyl-tRNA(Gln) amidotransferase subunit A